MLQQMPPSMAAKGNAVGMKHSSASAGSKTSNTNSRQHNQAFNGSSSDQERLQFGHVTTKTKNTNAKNAENEYHLQQPATANVITSSSPSHSSKVQFIRSNMPSSSSPVTPLFRRATVGDRSRGSMRKMLPALPDMDTQVCSFEICIGIDI